MIERDMRGQLVKLLAPIAAYAVENGGCHPGTPDIATVLGPIECKATNQWPARRETPVKLDHDLTKGQRIFLMRWHRAGGAAWVMLNIDGSWLLFEGMKAVLILGGKEPAARSQLHKNAVWNWYEKPKTEELLEALQKHPHCPSL